MHHVPPLLPSLLPSPPLPSPLLQVERFVFRPGLIDKARYYAVVFLNQLPLSHRDSEGGAALAKKLADLYFTLFRMVVEGHIGGAVALRKQQVRACACGVLARVHAAGLALRPIPAACRGWGLLRAAARWPGVAPLSTAYAQRIARGGGGRRSRMHDCMAGRLGGDEFKPFPR